MCGINGFITRKNVTNTENRIRRMNTSLYHRGPNAEGIASLDSGKVWLGQRRLSIIDIEERSNQPMSTVSGKSTIVYNGEIYNFEDLKGKLDYNFMTNSDTEVLLAGLERFGMEWLNECNGMYAFAYFDSEKKELFIARDRLGIKPLYYYANDEVVVFSSEIKGILNSGLVKAEFNYDAIDEYLGYRYIREPYTFFKNIYQVPAGSYIKINQNLELETIRYWSLPNEFNTETNYNEDRIYERFKEEVTEAIKRRMISDVPLGTYLSGGIDSSIISAVTALNMDNAVNTYTIGFDELNEFEYSNIVAEKYKTVHHTITLSEKDYFEMMDELIGYKDAPLGVPNEIPLAIMSKKLKENITVVLSGEGADELMGGYGKIYRSPFDYENIDRGKYEDFYSYFIDKYEYMPRSIRDKFLKVGAPLREVFDAKIKDEFANKSNEENVFRFFHNYHVKGLLQRVDITTMYASVEARVPFLDHKLVEFSYKNVPYNLKLKWKTKEAENSARKMSAAEYSEDLDQPKYLLRRMGLEMLPDEVVTRKKMGFPVPLNEWFDELIGYANEYLTGCDWISNNMIQELIEECRKNQRAGQLLWMLISVEMFKKKYFEREWRY